MFITVFQAEYISSDMKRADLTATICKQFVASNCAGSYLINVLGGLALTEDFHAFLVGEFIQTDDWVRSARHTEVHQRSRTGRYVRGETHKHRRNSLTLEEFPKHA